MDKLLVSIEEAAAVLGIRRTLLYELLRRGEIESVHVGRRRLIPRQALEDFVKRRRQESQEVAETVVRLERFG